MTTLIVLAFIAAGLWGWYMTDKDSFDAVFKNFLTYVVAGGAAAAEYFGGFFSNLF